MTFPSLQPLSYPRGRLEPKLTATGLYMVAIPRDRGNRKENDSKHYGRKCHPTEF